MAFLTGLDGLVVVRAGSLVRPLCFYRRPFIHLVFTVLSLNLSPPLLATLRIIQME